MHRLKRASPAASVHPREGSQIHYRVRLAPREASSDKAVRTMPASRQARRASCGILLCQGKRTRHDPPARRSPQRRMHFPFRDIVIGISCSPARRQKIWGIPWAGRPGAGNVQSPAHKMIRGRAFRIAFDKTFSPIDVERPVGWVEQREAHLGFCRSGGPRGARPTLHVHIIAQSPTKLRAELAGAVEVEVQAGCPSGALRAFAWSGFA